MKHSQANTDEVVELEFIGDVFELSPDKPCMKNYIEVKTTDDYANSGYR